MLMVAPGLRLSLSRLGQLAPLRRFPATGLSLRSPGRATDLFPEPQAFLVSAAPALSFLIARWKTSWPPGRPVCGPLPARRCHLIPEQVLHIHETLVRPRPTSTTSPAPVSLPMTTTPETWAQHGMSRPTATATPSSSHPSPTWSPPARSLSERRNVRLPWNQSSGNSRSSIFARGESAITICTQGSNRATARPPRRARGVLSEPSGADRQIPADYELQTARSNAPSSGRISAGPGVVMGGTDLVPKLSAEKGNIDSALAPRTSRMPA